ncbi:MAG: hypothetical protein ABI476_03680, partial [Oxalobacteraceae bacterium]
RDFIKNQTQQNRVLKVLRTSSDAEKQPFRATERNRTTGFRADFCTFSHVEGGESLREEFDIPLLLLLTYKLAQLTRYFRGAA